MGLSMDDYIRGTVAFVLPGLSALAFLSAIRPRNHDLFTMLGMITVTIACVAPFVKEYTGAMVAGSIVAGIIGFIAALRQRRQRDEY